MIQLILWDLMCFEFEKVQKGNDNLPRDPGIECGGGGGGETHPLYRKSEIIRFGLQNNTFTKELD
jgi:hypothetical protein